MVWINDGDGAVCCVEEGLYHRKFSTPNATVALLQHNAKYYLRYAYTDANEIGDRTHAPEENAIAQVCRLCIYAAVLYLFRGYPESVAAKRNAWT